MKEMKDKSKIKAVEKHKAHYISVVSVFFSFTSKIKKENRETDGT